MFKDVIEFCFFFVFFLSLFLYSLLFGSPDKARWGVLMPGCEDKAGDISAEKLPQLSF